MPGCTSSDQCMGQQYCNVYDGVCVPGGKHCDNTSDCQHEAISTWCDVRHTTFFDNYKRYDGKHLCVPPMQLDLYSACEVPGPNQPNPCGARGNKLQCTETPYHGSLCLMPNMPSPIPQQPSIYYWTPAPWEPQWQPPPICIGSNCP